MTTAETLGQGKSAFFVSANALFVKDYTTLSNSFAQYIYGVNNRVDLYLGPGVVTAFGQKQAYFSAGANLNLVKSRVASLSSFNLLSTACHRRADASRVLWLSALIVSHNFRLGKLPASGYGGYSVLVPSGPNKEEKLFTPPQTFHNMPLGLSVTLKKLTWFVEYNYGKRQRTIGLGLALGL
ncbi:MAG: hypothetical protein HY397_00125 [Candidatus Doudnabacteria bacterium]|nr:hypothetical protein [Candidatus Doudnabacteria bacterium]